MRKTVSKLTIGRQSSAIQCFPYPLIVVTMREMHPQDVGDLSPDAACRVQCEARVLGYIGDEFPSQAPEGRIGQADHLLAGNAHAASDNPYAGPRVSEQSQSGCGLPAPRLADEPKDLGLRNSP